MDNCVVTLFNQSEDYFFQSIARRVRNFDGLASAYSSDIKGEPQNSLVIRAEAPSLKVLLNDAGDFFSLTDTPWCIAMRDILVNQAVETIFNAYGFKSADVSVAMVLQLDKMLSVEPNNAQVKNMDTNLGQWAIPLKAYPATSDEVNFQYGKSHELALKRKRNLNHLSLFDHNQIISSLTLSWNNDWARIDDVATLPEYQGKGYATKLMKYGIRLAFKKGARVCFLEASPKGLSIYQKLGFIELFKNQVFVKKEPC